MSLHVMTSKSSSSGKTTTNKSSSSSSTINSEDELLKKVFKVIDESKQQQQNSRECLNKIMIDHEHALSIQLDNLSEIQTQIQSIEKRAVQLGKTISNTFKLAEGVSSKVRQLHGVQERVQLAIDAVEASIGMKSCVEGVEQAIKIGDYEKAVEYVSRVLHINSDSNRSKLALQLNQSQNGDQQESEDEQERRNTLFKKSEKKIKEIVSSKMKEALRDENETQIKRFSKLFSPLCMNEDGLSLYVDFLSDKCRKELESLVHDSLDKVSDLPIELNAIEDEVERLTYIRKQQQQYVSFIDIITQILDIIVSYIEDCEDFVTSNFGGEKCTIYLINSLQHVCDKMVKKVLDVYEKKRELNDILTAVSKKPNTLPIKKDLNTSRSPSPVPNSMESFLKQTKISPDDPRVLDLILEEIAEISSNIEVYKQFIAGKCINIKTDGKNEMYTLTKEPIIYRRIQELMSFYIPIDMSFMKQSFFKAIQLGDTNQISLNANTDFFESDSEEEEESDEDEDESSKYSSIINDVFFILQKSLSRAMDSQNVSVVCAIVNHINGILATDYFEFVKKDVNLISLIQSNNKDDFVKILKSLNNIQISSEYILKLKKEFERSYEIKFFKNKKAEPNSPDRMKLKSGASDLVQTSIFFSDELRRYTQKMVSAKEYCLSLEQDISFLLDSELKHPANSIAFYNLSESQFAARELNNIFTTKFIANMEKVLNVYKKYLTKFNFEELVELAIIILCDYLERQIFAKRFSSFGGLQLDKDVREFMDYFSSKTDRSVRDKFSRLTQIAYLLKMSEVDDILEIWESAQHWKLSVGEIKNVLSLRLDFKQEQIHNLSI